MKNNYPLVSSFLKEFSLEMDFEILIEPEYGYVGRIKTKDGKTHYFHSTRFDINPLGASEIAKDKTYAAFFMKELGYPVPEGNVFYSDYWAGTIKSPKDYKEAILYAEMLGYPLIVKPNSESQGRGVEKIHNREGLQKAFTEIVTTLKERVVIIQKVALGQDYRIVVLDNEVICAYLRTPLTVIGNGVSTIQDLLKTKQAEFIKHGRDTTINLDDPRIIRNLTHVNKSLSSILKKNEKLQLLANANLSSGGEAEDVTELLHPEYKKMAIELTLAMGLRFCGIDIMTEHPINKPMSGYTIIEINAAPGLDYYAETGSKQKEVVKNLYKKLILGMIQS